MSSKILSVAWVIIATLEISDPALLQNPSRWCYMDDVLSPDGYVVYNASSHACIKCMGKHYIELRKDMRHLKCCPDGSLKSKCSKNESRCGDEGFYLSSEKCDGMKNCVNFKDETNCTNICVPEMFTCYNSRMSINTTNQCVDQNQVCDGVKNCISGIDEANCTYYGGRCDGFLCTSIEECIRITKVCDGKKDCLDGTDETMCPENKDPGAFECKDYTGKPAIYTLDEVCDGKKVCGDHEDEKNCFQWTEWSEWSQCHCGKQQNMIQETGRTRVCGTLYQNTDTTNKCNGTDKQASKKTCYCESNNTTDSHTVTYVITGIIIAIFIICGILIFRIIRRQKKAWLSYSEALVSFRNPQADSLIDTLTTHPHQELQELNTGKYSERRLPATPPNRSGSNRSEPVLRFHEENSFQNGNTNEYQDSILTPVEDDGRLQPHSVLNPLYHSYTGSSVGEDHTYNNLSLPSTTAPQDNSSATYSVTNDDVFEDDFTSSNLIQQIEIARIGNLIEGDNLQID